MQCCIMLSIGAFDKVKNYGVDIVACRVKIEGEAG